MTHYAEEDMANLSSRFKANMINSSTGYKPCNLIATKSEKGVTNLGIFNSVVHIGSNPPLLGFILRPLTVPRHTYSNFKATKHFTVNQVSKSMITAAHQTSARYSEMESEFLATGLEEEYLNGFEAPYVKESSIKLGCTYVNEYEITENGCLLIIGKIEQIYFPENIQHKDGWLQLDKADSVTNIGLDGYSLPKLIDRLSYAKPNTVPTSLL